MPKTDFKIIDEKIVKYFGEGGDVVIPDGISEIGWFSFGGRDNIDSVTFSSSVRRIAHEAFSGCKNLTAVIFPANIEKVNRLAFWGCRNLKSVTVMGEKTKIDGEAFEINYLPLFHVKSINAIPAKIRSKAAYLFTKNISLFDEEEQKIYNKYIKSNAAKLIEFAVNDPVFLDLLCSEKVIPAKLVPEYITAIQNSGNTECIAMILDYSANKLSSAEKKRAEKDRNKVSEREFNRPVKAGIKDMCFAISGKLLTFDNRDKFKDFLKKKGARFTTSINANVDYLIMNDVAAAADKKLEADALGIKIISEYQFNDLSGRAFVINKDKVLTKYIGSGGDIVIPTKVVKIGWKAFSQCKNLTSVIISEKTEEISDYAFEYCTNLTSVSIPESVKKIGHGAFGWCKNLSSINLSDTIEEIESCFNGCTKLVDDDGFLILRNKLVLCDSSSERISIPDGVTKISATVGSFLPNLKSLIIPDSVTEIDSYAFSNCDQLISVKLPEHLIKIGNSVMSKCPCLTDVTIPETVTSIGWSLFERCPKIVVYVTEGSYAEQYMKENNIPFEAVKK